jgi:hypothetical protein
MGHNEVLPSEIQEEPIINSSIRNITYRVLDFPGDLRIMHTPLYWDKACAPRVVQPLKACNAIGPS